MTGGECDAQAAAARATSPLPALPVGPPQVAPPPPRKLNHFLTPDIRSIQHFDSSAHGLVRRWLFIGYFPSSRCHRRGYLSRCRRKLTAPFFFCTHPGAAADGVQQVPRPLHALHQDQGALPGAASAPPRAHPPVAPPRRRCVPKPLLNFN
jgi:hypothetical protein